MPRTPIEQHGLYVELAERLTLIESKNRRIIESAENAAKNARLKSEYEKSVAIMQTIKSGLSVYGAAKSAGIKSSLARKNLVTNCESIISEYENANGIVEDI